MNKTVNAPVNGAPLAKGDYAQVLENKWSEYGIEPVFTDLQSF